MGLLRNHDPGNATAPVDRGAGDAELVAQARLGVAQAFALLYHRYVHKIYAFSFDKLGNDAAAEDATQTAFFRALRSLERYKESGQFQGWLFTVAARVCADELRAKGRVALPLDAAAERESSDPPPEDRALEQERLRAEEERLRAVRRARQECLSARDRELYDLVVQELTHQEIATVLGKRAGAVRMAHTRLLDRLRICLGILTNLKGGRRVAS